MDFDGWEGSCQTPPGARADLRSRGATKAPHRIVVVAHGHDGGRRMSRLGAVERATRSLNLTIDVGEANEQFVRHMFLRQPLTLDPT